MSGKERRRVPGRGAADQPRPAAVRRGRGDQAGPGRLPRRRARPDHPGARGPAAVGDPGAPRPGAVHAEERPEVHARRGCRRCTLWAETSKRERVVRAVQRPPHAAVVRQPAGRSSTTRRWCSADRLDRATHLVLDLDPPEGDAFAHGRPAPRTSSARRSTDVGLAGAVKTSGAKGVHVFVPDRRRTRRSRTWPRRPGRSPRGPSARPGASRPPRS